MSKEDKLDVYDIKLEIAKRIEHIKKMDPRDYSDDASTHNRGVASGLESLYKWIKAKEEDDRE